jgi:hypothetical protein
MNGDKAQPEQLIASNYPHYLMKNKKRSLKERKRAEKRILQFDFEDVTVTELKEVLRILGKNATGKKTDLLGRVRMEYERIKSGVSDTDDECQQLAKSGEETTSQTSASLPKHTSPAASEPIPPASVLSAITNTRDASPTQLVGRSRSQSEPIKPSVNTFELEINIPEPRLCLSQTPISAPPLLDNFFPPSRSTLEGNSFYSDLMLPSPF